MKTDGELQYLARRYGWKAEHLTRARVNRMTADESDWHYRFNAEEFTCAWTEDQAKAENARKAEAEKTGRMWSDSATSEETQEAIREVAIFCKAFPQFIGSFVPNREALIEWLRLSSMPVTARNLATAFQALGAEGKLLLNPSAVGVGTEVEISGGRLKNHPQLWQILTPASAEARARTAERKMSAEEWKAAHIEDFRPEGGLELAKKTWDRNVATFCSSRPEYLASEANGEKMQAFIRANGLDYNAQGLEAAFQYLKARNELELKEATVIDGQATRYTNLGGRESGFPPKSDKYSFQKKINSMSSEEYLRRLNEDRQFREAVEALGR